MDRPVHQPDEPPVVHPTPYHCGLGVGQGACHTHAPLTILQSTVATHSGTMVRRTADPAPAPKKKRAKCSDEKIEGPKGLVGLARCAMGVGGSPLHTRRPAFSAQNASPAPGCQLPIPCHSVRPELARCHHLGGEPDRPYDLGWSYTLPTKWGVN